MTTIEDTPEEAAFRSQVRTALAARLRPKPPGAAFSVMGAGQDNLDDYGYIPIPRSLQSKLATAVNAIA